MECKGGGGSRCPSDSPKPTCLPGPQKRVAEQDERVIAAVGHQHALWDHAGVLGELEAEVITPWCERMVGKDPCCKGKETAHSGRRSAWYPHTGCVGQSVSRRGGRGWGVGVEEGGACGVCGCGGVGGSVGVGVGVGVEVGVGVGVGEGIGCGRGGGSGGGGGSRVGQHSPDKWGYHLSSPPSDSLMRLNRAVRTLGGGGMAPSFQSVREKDNWGRGGGHVRPKQTDEAQSLQ